MGTQPPPPQFTFSPIAPGVFVDSDALSVFSWILSGGKVNSKRPSPSVIVA